MGVSLVNSSSSDFLVPLILLLILRQDLYLTQHADRLWVSQCTAACYSLNPLLFQLLRWPWMLVSQ